MLDQSLAMASFLAVMWGQRQKQPQKYLPSRIGLFYLGVWALGRQLGSRAVQALGRYASAYFVMVSLSRFFPQALRLPATITGKDPVSGEFPWLYRALNLPYGLLERQMFHRVTERDVKTLKLGLAPYNQINSTMYLGLSPALLGNSSLPKDIGLVWDLCNEFENNHVPNAEYVCVPVWDQTVPQDVERFLEVVDRVSKFKGKVYFHCAFGIGRSSLAAAAVMIKRGLADSPEEALALIQRERPFVHWGPEPTEFMNKITPRLI